MKQQSKLLILLSLSLIVILASLELVMPTTAQAVDLTDVVLISEKTDLTSAISARNLFRSAYQNRYTWDSQFPGYIATVEIIGGASDYCGIGYKIIPSPGARSYTKSQTKL